MAPSGKTKEPLWYAEKVMCWTKVTELVRGQIIIETQIYLAQSQGLLPQNHVMMWFCGSLVCIIHGC
jgi:hypothetical protein